jgi:S-formylglutathione hydrolase FrmB
MGGMGALSYVAHHPDHVSRALLLAPYLGEARLIRELAEAKGVPECPAEAMTNEDHARRLWHWIGRYASSQPLSPKLYLGYGTHDRFARANALLGAHLPARHVITVPGGHDWRTWTHLWERFLASWGSRVG